MTMALDNILALFLLPFFGTLSDKVNTKIGKRMPFILAGTALSCVLLIILAGLSSQPAMLIPFIIILLLLLIAMGTYRSPAVSLMPELTPAPLRSKANAIINLMGTVGGVYTLLMIKFFVHTPTDGSLTNYMPMALSIVAIMVRSLGRETMDDLAAQTPLGRLGTPEDIAAAAAFLAGEEASFITGQILTVDGGFVG